jgi:DNA polymerase III alpha subunit
MMKSITADEQTGIEMLYRQRNINSIPFVQEVVDQFNRSALDLDLHPITSDTNYSKEFDIPQHYKDIDVEEYLLARAVDRISRERVEAELVEFKARNLFPVLQLLIYIVDTMRKHNTVWGVGRGSSVASYCLYLIGVHKIDSIKYNLDIREFLK